MKRQATAPVNEKQNKKKRSREIKTATKFIRYVNSLNPESVKKKKDYAAIPDVITRRKELNQKRNVENRILRTLIKNGMIYDKEGNCIDRIGGIVCVPDKKCYYQINKKGEIKELTYEHDLDLEEILPVDKTPDANDIEFNELCRKLSEGDPEIIDMISNKRKIVTVKNPIVSNLEIIKEEVRNRLQPIKKEVRKRVQQDDDSSSEEQ